MNPMNSCVLVTGGAGYIGSHATLALLQSGYEVIVIDNLCNSSSESLARVERLAGRAPRFFQGDIQDNDFLHKVFSSQKIDAVLHFAGLKSVSESAKDPFLYYANNVSGTIGLCRAMTKAKIYKMVFSSSATVYGETLKMPIGETSPVGDPTNPYGRSKLIVEEMLQDLIDSDPRWHIAILRYFNPIGAHPSGLIGEDPNGIPNNLLPYIGQVAVGKLKVLSIFGDNYPTHDGTGVRDYIHVVDLVDGHLRALQTISQQPGLGVWNLGTGHGYSVLEIIDAFEQASGQSVPYKVVPRRDGDVAECWADPDKALRDLGWKARRGLHEMMVDAWCWQSRNPNGYAKDLKR